MAVRVIDVLSIVVCLAIVCLAALNSAFQPKDRGRIWEIVEHAQSSSSPEVHEDALSDIGMELKGHWISTGVRRDLAVWIFVSAGMLLLLLVASVVAKKYSSRYGSAT